MKRRSSCLALLAAMPALAACHRTRTADVPVPSPAATAIAPVASATSSPATTDSARTPARRGYVEADVRFMQHMIMHHAQALAMTAMVPTHGASPDIHTVAERIQVSQRDEIGLMQRWLRARGEMIPDPMATGAMEHAQHAQHAGMSGMTMTDSAHAAMSMSMPVLMPGMLTPTELAQLDQSRGAAFDTLFVRDMIRHHEGALQMVKDYLATPGAAQESEIFRFASDVDADQRAEIRRMRTLLEK